MICGQSVVLTGSSEMAMKTLPLVALLALLELRLAAGSHPRCSMPGSPYNISLDDRGLQQVILNATYSFNNQSNDAFLFKASAIHRAQRQVVKGVRYIVDFDISRTICRKRENSNLSNCDFQPVGRLHQMFQCHMELWLIPWRSKSTTQVFFCKP